MEDFLLLDELYTAEERLTRDAVRKWVDDEVIARMEEAYEKAQFPQDFIPKLVELGLLGIMAPAEYGGSGANYIQYGLICQELERGDSALRSFVSVQNSLCMYPIYRFGSEDQKRKFIPKMVRGELIGCFGLTEPDSGSNPAEMKTTAKKVKEGWILNGTKMWITNANVSNLAIVWAKTADGIRGFIVLKNTPGFSTQFIHHKMSMRASDTGELIFDDCFIPEDHLLPGSESGLASALSCLTQARYGIAWGAIGAAMACFDVTLKYVKERHQFGKPIAAFQLIQKDLADCFTEINKAQSLNFRMGQLAEQNKLSPVCVSMAKMNAAREALHIARKCRNLLGANGITLDYQVIRHLENLETVFTYEGTDNVHHLILGKHLTGLDAFN